MSDAVEGETQVFIGNLPFTLDEDTLTNVVKEKHGGVFKSIKVIKSKDTGKSRGFGYITYNSRSEADNAINALKDLEFEGRTVKVDISVPMEKSGLKSRTQNENKLFVGNLEFRATEADVYDLANKILGPGVLQKVDLVLDRDTRRPRGFGYLHFNSKEDVELALSKLNGATLLNREIRLDLAVTKDRDARASPTEYRKEPAREFKPRTPRVGSEHSIYVGNLAWEVTEKIIEEMLADVVGPGLVTNIRMATDRDTGKSRGFAHVDFKDAESMERALVELDGMSIYDRVLKIDKAVMKEKRAFGSEGGGYARKPRVGGERYASSDSEQQSSFNNW